MEQDRQKVRQLYQQMTFPEKCKYLWSEFRLHFLAIALAAIVLISTVVHFLNKEEPVLSGMAINHSLSSPEASVEAWEAGLHLEPGSCISFMDGINLDPEEVNDPQSLSYASSYQIICAAAAKELDFVITDKDGLMFLYGNGIFRDVRDVVDESLLEMYGPYLYKPEELEISIALDLSGTPIAQKLGLTGEEVYLALPSLSGNDARLHDFLRHLYESATSAP